MSQEAERGGWWWIVVVLAALHVGLSCIYAAITPYCTPGVTNGRLLKDIGAPDERAHAEYIDHIYRRGLPVVETGPGRGEFDYEFHQPPLYYLMAFRWCHQVGVIDLYDPGGSSNILSPASGFRIRFLNCLIGGITIAGVYFLGLWAAKRREIAVGAAAIAALLPMLCAVDGAVSMDPLIICLSTWTLALLAKWSGSLCWWKAIVLGLLIGAALLTKSTGLLLLPVAVFAAFAGGGKGRWAYAAAIPILALAVALPWFSRNLQLYGDPLGLHAFYATFERDVFPAQVFSGFRPFAHWLYVLLAGSAQSFVGEFGYMDIHLPYAVYVPVWIAMGWAMAKGVRMRSEIEGQSARWSLALFCLLLLMGYISYNLWQVQPQARYLFPAIGVFGVWFAVGAQRIHRHGLAVLIGLAAAANLAALSALPGAFHQRVEGARAEGTR